MEIEDSSRGILHLFKPHFFFSPLATLAGKPPLPFSLSTFHSHAVSITNSIENVPPSYKSSSCFVGEMT